jgi:hypothetical protein
MNDDLDFLTRFRRPPRAAFAAALYHRISQPMKATPRRMFFRRAGIALAGFALVFSLSLLAVPALRVMAYDVLRQIGVISFTTAERRPPAEPSAARGLPDPTSTPIPPARPTTFTTLDQLEAEAGFRPLAPAYLPQGYVLDEMAPMEYLDDSGRGEGMGTFMRYVLAAQAEHYLDIQQTRFADDRQREFPIGNNPIQDVTVRGRPGIWLEQALLDAADNPKPHPLNVLLWEEDGFIHSLMSDVLPLEELQRVADSLSD